MRWDWRISPESEMPNEQVTKLRQMRSAHFTCCAVFFLDDAGCFDAPYSVNLTSHQKNAGAAQEVHNPKSLRKDHSATWDVCMVGEIHPSQVQAVEPSPGHFQCSDCSLPVFVHPHLSCRAQTHGQGVNIFHQVCRRGVSHLTSWKH